MESSYKAVHQDIKAKKFAPVYLLHGDEPFFIDEIAEAISENALSPSEKDFNFNILYGKDTDIDTIRSFANKYPMMASRQVLIIKEAQELKGLDKLQAYIDNPVTTTVMVLCHKHKKIDKRTKFYQSFKKNNSTVAVELKRIGERKIPEWIESYLHDKGYGIDPKASYLLTEYLGNDLQKIVNELDKLLLDDQTGKTISTENIERNIGISKDYNIFELQQALGRKDVVTTTKILNYFRANPKAHPLIMNIAMLFNYFSKLFALVYREKGKNEETVAKELGIPHFAVQEHIKAANRYRGRFFEVFDVLHEYDLRSKGINDASTDEPELMREMVYKLLYL